MKKVIGMFAALALALAMTGVAFAQWTDQVVINATVSTGTVDFRILDLGECEVSPGIVVEGSEVATGGKSATITISNTYPGAYGYLWINVKNAGSIPIKLSQMRIVRVSGPWDLMDWYKYAIPTGDTVCGITGPVYFEGTLTWWSTWRNFDDLAGLPNPSMAAGAERVLGAYFELGLGTPSGLQGQTLVVTVELEVKQA